MSIVSNLSLFTLEIYHLHCNQDGFYFIYIYKKSPYFLTVNLKGFSKQSNWDEHFTVCDSKTLRNDLTFSGQEK